MKRLGLICRADEGGLGVLTLDAARHLKPDVILIVRVDPPRGEELLDRYAGLAPEIIVAKHEAPDRRSWRDFVEASDVIYTAETCYHPDLPALCERAGVRLIVHAMPELYDGGPHPPYEVWAPTSWRLDLLPPGTPVVPVPIPDTPGPIGDGCYEDRPLPILHMSAPAMLDRNGTKDIKDALKHVTRPALLLIAGPERPGEPSKFGKVEIRPVASARDNRQVHWGSAAMLLPRRYGGLSLPLNEAAARGVPISATALVPQVEWLHPDLAIPATVRSRSRMKGGFVEVFHADQTVVAKMIDALSDPEPDQLVAWRGASLAYREAMSWSHWAPRYRSLLLDEAQVAVG